MFTAKELSRILFLDIETATLTKTFSHLPVRLQRAWEHEASKIKDIQFAHASAEEKYYTHGALYPEFGRVVCISVAFICDITDYSPRLMVKSFCGTDEKALLKALQQLVDKQRQYTSLCAHNGREFDFPFLGKRFIIRGTPLPQCLLMKDKASWETRHLIDTMHVWKFSLWKEQKRLELLAAALDVPTSKDDLDGSQVSEVFWQEKDYKRIAQYCEKDVIALSQIVLRMSCRPVIEPGQIVRREVSLLNEKDTVAG